MLNFTSTEISTPYGPAVLLEFEIEDDHISPQEFATETEMNEKLLIPPPNYGLLISGRGPIWGYAMLLHTAHPSSWIAVYDPRLGYVVVQSHSEGVDVGEVITINNSTQETADD